MIPYGRQSIDEEDIKAVVEVLRSEWLTTGPKVAEFELAFADFVQAKEAVAVSSGTAALHAAMHALGVGPGDEVIVPSMTFASTANCVVFQGAVPIFADVEPGTLLISPADVEARITPNTRAIIAVDYAGQPADYEALNLIARRHELTLVADACHALGASRDGCPVGSLADLNTFSFHPVKHITTGEGGMITTDDPKLAERMRMFRNHGIAADYRRREALGTWVYEIVDLGYNYRMTDLQCALGLSQLRRLPDFLERRREIAARYDQAFSSIVQIVPLTVDPNVVHAYHLYVIRLDLRRLAMERSSFFRSLRASGVGANVHYIPVHVHPFYRKKFHTAPGLCPVAEAAYKEILSIPIFPGMTESDIDAVVGGMMETVRGA